jgi:O-antigen/teichoic acid export membrane protein
VPDERASSEPASWAELQHATLAGLRPLAFARIASEVVALLATIVLARLVSPAEYGRAVVALIAVTLAAAVARRGFGAALVQRREVARAELEAAALLSLLSGIALTVAGLVLAHVAFPPLFGDDTSRLLELSSFAFLLAAPASVPEALVQRRLDFRRIAAVDVVSLCLGSAVAVVAAAAGAGGASVVVGGLVATGAATLLWLVSSPLVVPRWRPQAAREVAGFGVPAALEAMAYEAFVNVDYAVLAGRVPAAQLGFYWRAWQLGVGYQSKISSILVQAGFPVYARTPTFAQLDAIRHRLVRTQTTVVVPLLALLIPLAPTLVPAVFGARWSPAVEPTQILALAGMAVAVGTGAGPVVLAAGRPRVMLAFTATATVAYGLLVYFAAPWGLVGLAWAVVAFHAVWLATLCVILRGVARIPVSSLGRDLAPAFASTLVMLAVAWPIAGALREAGASSVLLLVCVGAAAAVVYGISLRTLFHATFADLTLAARRVLTGGGGPRRGGLARSAPD